MPCAGTCRMGKLLRHRRSGCRRPDRIAVCRHDAHCREAARGSADAGAAFATPTIVHFGSALLLSALVRVPWRTSRPPPLLGSHRSRGRCTPSSSFGGCGCSRYTGRNSKTGCFMSCCPSRRTQSRSSAFAASSHTREALFGVGAAALLLLFIGIHNAWDGVAYHVFVTRRNAEAKQGRGENP